MSIPLSQLIVHLFKAVQSGGILPALHTLQLQFGCLGLGNYFFIRGALFRSHFARTALQLGERATTAPAPAA